MYIRSHLAQSLFTILHPTDLMFLRGIVCLLHISIVVEGLQQKPHTHMALEWEIFEEKTKTKQTFCLGIPNATLIQEIVDSNASFAFRIKKNPNANFYFRFFSSQTFWIPMADFASINFLK